VVGAGAALRAVPIGCNANSPFGGVNWAAEDGKYLTRADPYFVWTDTVSTGTGNSTGLSSWIAVLAELEDGGVPPIFHPDNPDKPDNLLAVPSHFYPTGTRKFMPLLVDPKRMSVLVGLVARKSKVLRFEFCQPRAVPPGVVSPQLWQRILSLPKLALPPQVIRDLELEAFRPQRPMQAPLQPPHRDDVIVNREQPSRQTGMPGPSEFADLVAGPAPKRDYRYPRTDSGQPLALVVDDRCNFASARLRGTGGQPVVHSVWHQSDDPRVYDRLDKFSRDGLTDRPLRWTSAFTFSWDAKSGFWFHGAVSGRRLDVWGTKLLDVVGEEADAYRVTEYLPVMHGWSHGSAVVNTIVNGVRRPGVGARPASAAMAANSVLFAQLPSPTVEDTGGGSLSCVALDAIRDALHLADSADKRRLIVNLSYGTYSGPHDGTSLFERALSELLADNERLHVVLPAGNSHLSRTHAGCWLGPGKTATLRWKVQPDNPADSFAEVWFDAPAMAQVALLPPAAGELRWVGFGHAEKLCRGDKPVAAVIFPTKVAQGKHGSMALCAVSGTRQATDAVDADTLGHVGLFPRHSVPATPGIWKIRVHNKSPTAPLRFDAWIQRGDSAPGRSRAISGYAGRQGYFLDAVEGDETSLGPDPSGTLNGIATGTGPEGRLIVAGASRRCDGGLSTYSSAGPGRLADNRCHGPDVVVPSDESIALPGVLTGGMLGSSRVRVGGTSIAAALVTRMLYDHLAERPQNTARTFHESLVPRSTATTRPIVPAGAPEHAAPFLRGEFQPADADGENLPRGSQCPGEPC
jgi:hypothetical protein